MRTIVANKDPKQTKEWTEELEKDLEEHGVDFEIFDDEVVICSGCGWYGAKSDAIKDGIDWFCQGCARRTS